MSNFAVKDNNIDVAGACRQPPHVPSNSPTLPPPPRPSSNTLLLKAGRDPHRQNSNLDQFACGLTGLLSSYGPTQNPFNPDYISGGSSSGSAVALAAGLVSLRTGHLTPPALAAFPQVSTISSASSPRAYAFNSAAFVPACRSLDCLFPS